MQNKLKFHQYTYLYDNSKLYKATCPNKKSFINIESDIILYKNSGTIYSRKGNIILGYIIYLTMQKEVEVIQYRATELVPPYQIPIG